MCSGWITVRRWCLSNQWRSFIYCYYHNLSFGFRFPNYERRKATVLVTISLLIYTFVVLLLKIQRKIYLKIAKSKVFILSCGLLEKTRDI